MCFVCLKVDVWVLLSNWKVIILGFMIAVTIYIVENMTVLPLMFHLLSDWISSVNSADFHELKSPTNTQEMHCAHMTAQAQPGTNLWY